MISFFSEVLSMDNASKVKNCDIVSVFIYSRVDNNALKSLKKVKMISTRSTGFDNIDLKSCKQKKISVQNVPAYGENTVAEHTFALILSLSRNIHKSYMRSLDHDFSIEGLKGFDLKGKTISIIGAGHIGLHVIRMARAFSMKVLVFDVNRDEFMADVLGYQYVSFDEALKKADIISLKAPNNIHTHHMMNM